MPFVIDYNAPAAWGGGGALTGYGEIAKYNQQFAADMNQRQFQNQLNLAKHQEDMRNSEFQRQQAQEQLRMQRDSLGLRDKWTQMQEQGKNERLQTTEQGKDQRQQNALDFKAGEAEKNRKAKEDQFNKTLKFRQDQMKTMDASRKAAREATERIRDANLKLRLQAMDQQDEQFNRTFVQKEQQHQDRMKYLYANRADTPISAIEKQKENYLDAQRDRYVMQMNQTRNLITQKTQQLGATSNPEMSRQLEGEIVQLNQQLVQHQQNVQTIYTEMENHHKAVLERMNKERAQKEQEKNATTQPSQGGSATQPSQGGAATQPSQGAGGQNPGEKPREWATVHVIRDSMDFDGDGALSDGWTEDREIALATNVTADQFKNTFWGIIKTRKGQNLTESDLRSIAALVDHNDPASVGALGEFLQSQGYGLDGQMIKPGLTSQDYLDYRIAENRLNQYKPLNDADMAVLLAGMFGGNKERFVADLESRGYDPMTGKRKKK